MGLISEAGEGPVAVDTLVFIYFIEEHERYLPLVAPIFEAMDRGAIECVTSGLTLMETLVMPYRRRDRLLAEQYEALLTRSRGMRLVELSNALLRKAAELRVELEVRAPDAIQLAAAVTLRWLEDTRNEALSGSSLHFSPAFCCGVVSACICCVTLAQAPRRNFEYACGAGARKPCSYRQLRRLATKLVRNAGLPNEKCAILLPIIESSREAACAEQRSTATACYGSMR